LTTDYPMPGAAPRTALDLIRRQRSLLMQLTALVMVVVVFFSGLAYLLLQDHLKQLRNHELQQQLRVTKEVVEQRLSFYHDMLRAYARDQQVRDLLVFGSAETALQWSARVRDTLPQAVGAALFTAKGEVLGDPIAQRVGKACLGDLAERLSGRARDTMPIHSEVPELAHFDMSLPVRDAAGDLLGLVFVSFSINELFSVMDRVASPRESAALIHLDSGVAIATSPNWYQLQGGDLVTANLAGTEWQLQLRMIGGSLAPALPGVGTVILGGAAVVLLLMLLASRLLSNSLTRQMERFLAEHEA
jgi:hypothetical protein